MKTNEKKDLQLKKVEELNNLLLQKRKDLAISGLSHVRGKLKNPRTLRMLRKEIAQISTILRRKELSDEKNT